MAVSIGTQASPTRAYALNQEGVTALLFTVWLPHQQHQCHLGACEMAAWGPAQDWRDPGRSACIAICWFHHLSRACLNNQVPFLSHIFLLKCENVSKKSWVQWPGLIPQTSPWFDDFETLPLNKYLQRLKRSCTARRRGCIRLREVNIWPCCELQWSR